MRLKKPFESAHIMAGDDKKRHIDGISVEIIMTGSNRGDEVVKK